MFGSFRYVLASMVALTHLWPAQSMWWGVYAVFCFYLVSGYLMTLVLDQTYPYTRDGLSRYALNRALRLYAPYLVICAVALVLIHFLPEAARHTNYKLTWPASARQWLANLFIFGLLQDTSQALVPPAWSLNIEVVYWVLMGLLLSRHRTIVTTWFIASVGYTAYLLFTSHEFGPRYNTIPGASLPFAAGAMLYVYRHRLEWLQPWTALVSAPLFLGNAAVAAYHPLVGVMSTHFYLSLFFGALLLSALTRLRPSDLPAWFQRLDRLGGNVSYPIFLCHFHVAIIVVWLGFEGGRPKDSFAFWATSFVFTNLAAWVLYRGVDRRVDRVRDQVRKRKASRAAAHAEPR